MHNIEKNLAAVRRQIAQAAQGCGRDPAEIRLLAVSKTKPVEDILAAYAAGQRDFGENYLQEAEKKIATLPHKDIIWHYIGPIQSNKTRLIAEHFDWVHSVDRLKVARRLNEQRLPELAPLNILLQVNIDHEPSKSGIDVNEIGELATQIEEFPRLQLRGLMAIPARHTDPAQQRQPFARMHRALLELQQAHSDCDTLSMGMSGDMQTAIEQGSTLVRIGTAIFGARDYPTTDKT
jgi:pyridoxal phosphate enzyme (YggS family)